MTHPSPHFRARFLAPIFRSAGRRVGGLWGLTVGALLGAVACDGAVASVDASMPVSAHTSAVSVRIDVAPAQPASMSVLAFRAAFSGVAAADVLGMVDSLAADAPLRDCELRDVHQAAAALVARGDVIELEELAGIGISVGATSAAEIRPSPRLFPDLAATIGGVVSEAGPLRLPTVPALVRVRGAAIGPALAAARTSGGAGDATEDSATIAVPVTGWVKSLNGTTPRDGILISLGSDLNLNLAQPDAGDTSIELRPFGRTVALSCTVPQGSALTPTADGGGQISFVIPRQALVALVATSGAAPGASVAAALDLVRRTNRILPVSATRVSLEVRTSTFVELRP